jgi:hypothetical protein
MPEWQSQSTQTLPPRHPHMIKTVLFETHKTLPPRIRKTALKPQGPAEYRSQIGLNDARIDHSGS